jgi:hypothetical protein
MLSEPQVRIDVDLTQASGQPIAEQQPQHGPTRLQIEHLESHLIGLPQTEIPATHRFAPGLYMREIRVPAGTLMTGRVHRFEHVSVMVSGAMTTLVDGEMKRIEGYHPFIAPAGTKRVGYTHTEVVWLTVHLNPDELRDIEQIEATLCEPMNILPGQEAACLS